MKVEEGKLSGGIKLDLRREVARMRFSVFTLSASMRESWIVEMEESSGLW